MQATYGQEGEIKITSFREHTLFQILHILRHLDQPLAESLIASHPQLAAAACRFPFGMESIMREAEERKKSKGESCGGFVMAGSSDDFPYLKALMQGSESGDFEQAMGHAHEQYGNDAAPENPNLAPLEFWSSASRYHSILHAAGKRLGAHAGRYLAGIDDPNLRLFAQIELAAALAGLPEFRGIQREYRPRSVRARSPNAPTGARSSGFGPTGQTIRCPKCNWIPRQDDRWKCKCGHRSNTFETGGSCSRAPLPVERNRVMRLCPQEFAL